MQFIFRVSGYQKYYPKELGYGRSKHLDTSPIFFSSTKFCRYISNFLKIIHSRCLCVIVDDSRALIHRTKKDDSCTVYHNTLRT